MKKIFIIILVFKIQILFAQVDKVLDFAAGAAVAGVVASLTLEDYSNQFQQEAVEYFIANHPEIKHFDLSKSTLFASKNSFNTSAASFEISDYDNTKRYVLFAFTSQGWINEFGINTNKVNWQIFNQGEWNKLIKAYLDSVSKNFILEELIIKGKLTDKGLKIDNRYIMQFPLNLKNNYYSINEYNENIKVVFNRKDINLFLSETGELVRIKQKTIIRLHEFINFQF